MSKDKLRGMDYRKTRIYITIARYQFANCEVKLLLVTLCEMIEIYYGQEENRSLKMIFHLHNLCWRRATQCRRVLTPPNKFTYRNTHKEEGFCYRGYFFPTARKTHRRALKPPVTECPLLLVCERKYGFTDICNRIIS